MLARRHTIRVLMGHRYQEIAERAFKVGQQRAVQSGQQAKARVLVGKPMPFPHMLAQELFRMTLFCVFFIQSLTAGCVPFVGEHLAWNPSRAHMKATPHSSNCTPEAGVMETAA